MATPRSSSSVNSNSYHDSSTLATPVTVLVGGGRGEDCVTFRKVLEERQDQLLEVEIWAICQEAVNSLVRMDENSEESQLLCITPDTLAFDSAGSICFLSSIFDPDPMFRSSEYDAVGNTISTHVYSLGMSLWLAVQYGSIVGSAALRLLLADMTAEDCEERPDLTAVAASCDRQLEGQSADILCNEIAAAARWDTLGVSRGGNDDVKRLLDNASLCSVNHGINLGNSSGGSLDISFQAVENTMSENLDTLAQVSSSLCSAEEVMNDEQELQWASLDQLDGSGLGVVRCTAECLAVFREMCAAASQLKAASTSRFYEHGLTGENIVIWEDGQVSIIEEEEDEAVSRTGSTGFASVLDSNMAAPEVVNGGHFVWDKSLVYNLGVLLCHVIDVDEDEDAGEKDSSNDVMKGGRGPTELGPRRLTEAAWRLVMAACRDEPSLRPGLRQVVETCDALDQDHSLTYQEVLAGMFTRCTQPPGSVSGLLGLPGPGESPSLYSMTEATVASILPDDLLAQIVSTGGRKLRRCPWPRELSVQELFSQHHDWMLELAKITQNSNKVLQKTHSQGSGSSVGACGRLGDRSCSLPVVNGPTSASSSAFRTIDGKSKISGNIRTSSSHQSMIGPLTAANKQEATSDGQLPHAFTSPLTHFRPIVVRSDADVRPNLQNPTLEDMGQKLANRLRQLKAQTQSSSNHDIQRRDSSTECEAPNGTQSTNNLPSNPASFNGHTHFQVVHDPVSGLYQLLPTTYPPPAASSSTSTGATIMTSAALPVSNAPPIDITDRRQRQNERPLSSASSTSDVDKPDWLSASANGGRGDLVRSGASFVSSNDNRSTNANSLMQSVNAAVTQLALASNDRGQRRPDMSTDHTTTKKLKKMSGGGGMEPISDDSGVALACSRWPTYNGSALNQRGTSFSLKKHQVEEHPSPLDRLLSRDSLDYQRTLTRLIHLIQAAFGGEGSTRNTRTGSGSGGGEATAPSYSDFDSGYDDLALAEYIGSLENLSPETFTRAVRERYRNMDWSEELVANLYSVVNGNELQQPIRKDGDGSNVSSENSSIGGGGEMKGLIRNGIRDQGIVVIGSSLSTCLTATGGGKQMTVVKDAPLKQATEAPTSHEAIGPHLSTVNVAMERVVGCDDGRKPWQQLGLDSEAACYKTATVYRVATMMAYLRETTPLKVVDMPRMELTCKIDEVSRQISALLKQRAKTETLCQRMRHTWTGQRKGKHDQKQVSMQFLKDVEENTRLLERIDSQKGKFEVLLCELDSVPLTLLGSLTSSLDSGVLCLHDSDGEQESQGGSGSIWDSLQIGNSTKKASRRKLSADKGSDLDDLTSLTKATPRALMACLFARGALCSGYLHTFLLGFRYFLQPTELFHFLRGVWHLVTRVTTSATATTSSSSNSSVNTTVVSPPLLLGDEGVKQRRSLARRVVLILAAWVDGFSSVDFRDCKSLWREVSGFLKEEAIPLLSAREGESLDALIKSVMSADLSHWELHFPLASIDGCSDSSIFSTSSPVTKTPIVTSRNRDLRTALLDLPNELLTSMQLTGNPVARTPSKKKQQSQLSPLVSRDNRPGFCLLDHSPQVLAQALTLLEQAFFLPGRLHPCHFLRQLEDSDGQSTPVNMLGLSDWLEHCRRVTHWVTAEVVTAGSVKRQVQAIICLLTTGQVCLHLHNYATLVSILAGLEAPRLAWAPAWAALPAKWTTLRHQLGQARLLLASGEEAGLLACGGWGTGGIGGPSALVIPHPDTLLMLVRQAKVGRLTTTAGWIKWAKIRTVCQIVDQIRLLQQFRYSETTVSPEVSSLKTALTHHVAHLIRFDLDILQAQCNSTPLIRRSKRSLMQKIKLRVTKD